MLSIPETDSPSVPATGTLLLYSQTFEPGQLSSTGSSVVKQTFKNLSANRTSFCYYPRTGSSLGYQFNLPINTNGTLVISHPLPTSTASFGDTMKRTRISGTLDAGSPAGIFTDTNGIYFCRRNGFYIRTRMRRVTNGPHSRGTILMLAQAFGSGYQPSQAHDSIGFTYDTTDVFPSNYFLHTRNGADEGANLTKWDLGSGAPRNDEQVYDASFYCAPSASVIHALLINITSGTQNVVFNTAITGNLPDMNALMFAEINASPGSGSDAPQVGQILECMFIEGFY